MTGPAESSRGIGDLFGPRVDTSELRDIYAPEEVEPFTVRPGGIDNLALHSTDVFSVPGRGEYTVDFSGYFRVVRSHPTTDEWASAEIRVNIIDLRLLGQHDELGEVRVSLNPDIIASGQMFQAVGPLQPKACRIATGAVFDIPQMGVSVFNKEPILLMNEHVIRMPPVDDPSGHALLFRLPLYDRQDPDGQPVAYLTSLRYGADNYITEAEVRRFREES